MKAQSKTGPATLGLLNDNHLVWCAIGTDVDTKLAVVSNVKIYSVFKIGISVLFETHDNFVAVGSIDLVFVDSVHNISLGVSNEIQWIDRDLLQTVPTQLIVLGSIETHYWGIVFRVGISHHPGSITVWV